MKSRAYCNMDYKAVIAFLNEIYEINKNQHSWLPARWEYAEYFISPLKTILGYKNWITSMRLWINDDFKIVGIVGSENPDQQAFIQIHPNYRHIEDEMIEWAEGNIAIDKDNGEGKRVIIFCHDGDEYREDILRKRGFEKSERFEFLKWQSLEKDIEEINLPEGYSIHSFDQETQIEQKIVCIVKSFHPTADCRVDNIDADDLAIFRSLQNATLYRKNLDIYTKYNDEMISSTALAWFDPVSNIGVFEPVAAHPDHQGKGIGKLTILEGLRRLKELGAKTAYVGTHGLNQSKFYESVGFVEFDKYREWVKLIK
jgi:N-acetylglutamate synthase-like GNAT family acetyltransferase